MPKVSLLISRDTLRERSLTCIDRSWISLRFPHVTVQPCMKVTAPHSAIDEPGCFPVGETYGAGELYSPLEVAFVLRTLAGNDLDGRNRGS
jgi:hypothetical protein